MPSGLLRSLISCAYNEPMKKAHTPINQLILDTKDISMFPITRITTGDAKYWLLTDLRNGQTRHYKTKHTAQLAICAVIRTAMGENK